MNNIDRPAAQARTFINSLDEYVIELDVYVPPELSANFRWSGKTLLEAAQAVSTISSKECEPFLKEGETPAECIQRNRDDVSVMLGLLAKERKENEILKNLLRSLGYVQVKGIGKL